MTQTMLEQSAQITQTGLAQMQSSISSAMAEQTHLLLGRVVTAGQDPAPTGPRPELFDLTLERMGDAPRSPSYHASSGTMSP
eukprot:5126983-Alexandrium_andersonii.AAC.1